MALIIRVSSFLNLKTPMNLVSSKVYRVITGQLLSGKQFLGVAHSPARKAGHAPIAVSMEREAAFPFSWRSHRYGKAATAQSCKAEENFLYLTSTRARQGPRHSSERLCSESEKEAGTLTEGMSDIQRGQKAIEFVTTRSTS